MSHIVVKVKTNNCAYCSSDPTVVIQNRPKLSVMETPPKDL